MQIEYILGEINAYGDNIRGLPPFRTNDLVRKVRSAPRTKRSLPVAGQTKNSSPKTAWKN